MPERPNILFLLVDCLGSRPVFDPSRGARIPTIRALMERGTTFPACVATATTTSPSMATLFTGVLPFRHGMRSLKGYKLDPDVATLAEVLRDQGYHTHAEATGPVVTQKGFDRGFDTFNHRRGKRYLRVHMDELRRQMEALPSDRPWFVYLHLWELHRPRYTPPPFDRRRYGRHRYERALSALDQSQLPTVLELAGPDTLVVLTGDHGEVPRYDFLHRVTGRLHVAPLTRYVNHHSGHGHHVYEDLVLVPLVLAGPGVPAGREVRTAVRHMDLFPTILDLAGIDDRRRAQAAGESLVPLFEGEGPDRPGYAEAVGVTIGGPEDWLVSVRHGGWKYVRQAFGEGAWLWRLPDERGDLSSAHPEVVAEMEALLERFRAGASLTATGGELSAEESAEVEEHLKELGYLE